MNHRNLKQICRACAIGALPLLLAGFTACTSSNTVANGDTDALCDAAERHYRSSHETAFQYYRAAVSRGSIRAMCKLAERLTQEADVSAPDKRKAYAAEAVDVATRGTRMTDADYGWRAGCYVALARLYNDRKYGVYNRSKAIDCARTAARVNPCDFCNNFYSEIAGGPAGPQSPASAAHKVFVMKYYTPREMATSAGEYSVGPGNYTYTIGMVSDSCRDDKFDMSTGGFQANRGFFRECTYRKTGPKTALIKTRDYPYEGVQCWREIYLTFTSPNSGEMKTEFYGYNPWYAAAPYKRCDGTVYGTFEISGSTNRNFYIPEHD